ncbi:hypothetical protein ACLB2K_057730 [Fragaria x ananassa]
MAIASPTKLLAGDLASSFSFSRSSANPKLLSSSSPSRVYFAAPKTLRFQVFAFAVKRSPKHLKYSGPRFTKEDELLYVEVDPSGDDSWKLEPVLDLLKQGAVGVVPTDTMYAIVCDPRNHSAVDCLCRIKKIESTKPLTILCHSFHDIDRFTTGSPRGDSKGHANIFRAVKQCLPGPYTFILTATKELPKQCIRFGTTTAKYKSRKNVGVRMPDDAICQAILEKMDSPLISTSCKCPKENEWILDPVVIADTYGPEGLDFVIDGGLRVADPSTVVDMTVFPPKIMRQGKGPQLHWMVAEDDNEPAEGVLIKSLQLCLFAFIIGYIQILAESTVLILFDRAPPARSRYSYAVFRYSVVTLDGSDACKDRMCFVHCQLDGQTLSPCPAKVVVFRNLTVNRDHEFLVNVTTPGGQRNSSAHSWFIDTIPPAATIFSEKDHTSAERISIDITFSEACAGKGGFRCVNSSSCDVIVQGPAYVHASSLRMIKPSIEYNLDVILSFTSMNGRVVIRMADKFCTDQAGNSFTRTNGSTIIIHFDRRPVLADLWTSVPAYELVMNGVPRTVLATNKMEDVQIFLGFSMPIVNTTEQVLNAMIVNSGKLIPILRRNQGSRQFNFQVGGNLQLWNISRTEIIVIKLQAGLLVGRTGTPVSPVPSITFLYDSMETGVALSTSSPNVTKDHSINVVVEFTKPVFGFEVSMINVDGGKVYDISGNLNMASNQLAVKHYSTPAISMALQSFVSAGILATSLAAAILSISSAHLGAVGIACERINVVASDSLMNLHGLVGHLQVFVLSDWLSVNQPIEYFETTKENLQRKSIALSARGSSHKGAIYESYPVNSSYMCNGVPVPIEMGPKSGWLLGQHNMHMTPYGLPLHSDEYFLYFLRGEPLSASNVIKAMENYLGWEDLLMNLFWLGIGGGSLVVIHLLILLFLRWRTGTPSHGLLSVPRFELFLLILMLPCISQSSTFVIKGGTTEGIITGALLLAIPAAALIISVCLFQLIAIFSGSYVQYKEIKHVASKELWSTRLWYSFTGRPSAGKWFYKEGIPSSFLPRFGILFESLKGPPLFFFVDQNEPNSISKWNGSGYSGVGRMQQVSLDGSMEEIKIPISKRVLGCARSSYIIIDLSRRVCLGIICGAYSSRKSNQSIFALTITLVQYIYLFTVKPYISRGVHVVESISLLCEVGVFALYISINGSNPMKTRNEGVLLLSLLFLTFVAQIINVWYALMKFILRFSQPQKNSFKLGLKFAAKGLILPFLPKKQWPRVIPASSHPKTGLPPGPDTKSGRRDMRAPGSITVSAMTATVVPVLSPGSPGPNVRQMTAGSSTPETTLDTRRAVEAKQLKGQKLRALASFSGDTNFEEASTSYVPKP